MIHKIDSNSIRFNEFNFNHLIEKYNVLVELYGMSVHCQMQYQQLYEVGFDEKQTLKEQNTSLLIQLEKAMKNDELLFNES